jgi:hypothetical protein
MKFKHVALTALLIWSWQVQIALSETRLGLHVTQEELNVWKQRAARGPYKAKTDVSANSPGDWSRIVSNANSFLLNPSAERWSGQNTDACAMQASRLRRVDGVKIRDAAFYYLVVGDTKYRDAVKSELLAQAAIPGTDFRNRTRWCVGGNAHLDPANWIGRLLFAYDYIRRDISSDERTRLDAWFLSAAIFLEGNVHLAAAKRWPNRKNDSYGTSPMPLGPARGNIYYGAPIVYDWHLAWNNIFAVMTRTFGLIGIMLENDMLKSEAKRWFKESLRYIVWYKNTDNIATHGEYMRCCWTSISHFPTLGFHYVSSSLLSMTMLADAFSRTGDNELYTYTTSEGYNTTEGGPKSLKAIIQTHLQMMNHTIVRYGTSNASDVGNSNFIIDNVYEPTGWHHVGDAWIVGLANRFYKDNSFNLVSRRTNSTITSYPSIPSSTGVDGWMGDYGTFPGILFMFGNM